MPNSTSRLALAEPIGSDAVSELRLSTAANAATLDAAAMYSQGTLGSIPSAGSVPNGSVYLATDTGTLSVGDGTSWHPYAPQLTMAYVSSTATAAMGKMSSVNPGVTITLPAPTAGGMLGIVANGSTTGASPVTVAYGSSVIYGPGTIGVSSYKLGTPGAQTILLADGTNWKIISGQQDTGWVPLTFPSGISGGTGHAPSVRRRGDEIQLAGIISVGLSGVTEIATLPTAFWPPTDVLLPGTVDANNLGHGGGSAYPNFAITVFAATGTLNLATASNGTGSVSLNGLRFSPV